MANEKSQNVQDVFLNHVRKNKTPVTVFLVNGVKLQGIITWFDNFSVLLRRDGHTQLVYKHAISTVMPGAPIQLFDADQGRGRRQRRPGRLTPAAGETDGRRSASRDDAAGRDPADPVRRHPALGAIRAAAATPARRSAERRGRAAEARLAEAVGLPPRSVWSSCTPRSCRCAPAARPRCWARARSQRRAQAIAAPAGRRWRSSMRR